MKNLNRYEKGVAFQMRVLKLLFVLVIIAALLAGGTYAYDNYYPKYVEYKETKRLEAEAEQKRAAEERERLQKEQEETEQARIAALELPTLRWDLGESFSEVNGNTSMPLGEMYRDTFTDDYGNSIAGAYFDGEGDYIECGRGVNLTGQDTFTFLFNCQDVDKDYSHVFAKYETNGEGSYGFSIHYGKFNCWITHEDSGYIELESDTEIEENRWYFVSVVINGSDMSLYINGELDAECEIGTFKKNEDLVTIGRQALLFYPEGDLQFTGVIAEVSYYDSVLSAEDVKYLSDKRIVND